MTIASELTALADAKAAIKAAIEGKGQSLSGVNLAGYAAKISAISGGGGSADANGWTRPAQWPAMPSIGATEEKIVGLKAVYPNDGGWCSVRASGAYTVDWGDGSSENAASNTNAEHVYNYASLPGPVDSDGAKFVFVTITPQSGQVLTALLLNQRHSARSSSYESGWLDIHANMPSYTNGNFTIGTSSANVYFRHLERIVWHNPRSTRTDAGGMFRNVQGLRTFSVTKLNLLTKTDLMFSTCSVRCVPQLEGVTPTHVANMFSNCADLVVAPSMSTAGVTDIAGMFTGAYSLREIPAYDFSGVTAATTNAFTNCASVARARFTGLSQTFSIANCSLSGAALDEIYTNLPTVTGKTITVTGNYGTATHTTSIATAKGWTVTA